MCWREESGNCRCECTNSMQVEDTPISMMIDSGDSISLDRDHSFEARVTGGTWHTCTCKDGSTYECQSALGDGKQCCGRSMPAICGEGNTPDSRSVSDFSNDAITFDP